MGKVFSWLARNLWGSFWWPVKSLWDDFLWLARSLWGDGYWKAHCRAMRRSWALAAAELDLSYSRGTALEDDEITGKLDGFTIVICNVFNVDVQKLETQVWVFSESAPGVSAALDAKDLMLAYDESVQDRGVVPEGVLTRRGRAWLLGHWYGLGVEVVEGGLLYRQFYGMNNAAHIILVTRAMILTIRQLTYRNHAITDVPPAHAIQPARKEIEGNGNR